VGGHRITVAGETTEVCNAGELKIALDVLHGAHDRQVLEQLRPHLAEIVETPEGLDGILKSLTVEDQVYLLEAVGPQLASLLRESRWLRDILAWTASREVEEALLRGLGRDGLRALIQDAEDLAELLEWVYGGVDLEILELLGREEVGRLVRTGTDLAEVLTSVDAGAKELVLEAVGWERAAALLRDGRDLAYVIRALPAGLATRFLDTLGTERVVEVIGNADDWRYLVDRLEPHEAEHLYAMLGVETR
jgi:hypothetical protein